MAILLIVLLAAYFLIGVRIESWRMLKRIGGVGVLETTEGYLKHPHLFHWISYTPLLLAALLVAVNSGLGCFIWFPLMLVIWLAVAIAGRTRAFRIYRSVLKEMLEEPKDEEQRIWLEEELAQSNLQILQRLREFEEMRSG